MNGRVWRKSGTHLLHRHTAHTDNFLGMDVKFKRASKSHISPGESIAATFCSVTTLCLMVLLLLLPRTQNPTPIIVVPDGGVPSHTKLRVEKAVELFKKMKENGKHPTILTLSGGTPHKPNPLDQAGFPIWESTAAASALIKMGIPPRCIFEESFSLDTVGNAFFLRTVHLSPGRLRKLFVITNDWHMPRTKKIFETIVSLPERSCTFCASYLHSLLGIKEFEVDYITVGSGLDEESHRARVQREKASLVAFTEETMLKFNDMVTLHKWLFTSHSAYSSQRLVGGRATHLAADVLKTY